MVNAQGENIRLSIVTPVYNGSLYIATCLENVALQAGEDIEHIVIDGGSTDGTVNIIERYANQYSHIRWLSEKDRGQSDAMNKGVELARGSILGFLNVDDFYEPGAISEVISTFDSLSVPSLLVGNCNVWDNDGNLSFVSKPFQISLKNLLLENFLTAFPMNSSAYFYHTSLHDIIGPYEIDEHYGMDVHFILKSVQKSNVSYVNKTWGNYRYLKGSKSYEFDMVGGNEKMVRRIIGQYRKQQPLYYRVYLTLISGLNIITKLIRGRVTEDL